MLRLDIAILTATCYHSLLGYDGEVVRSRRRRTERASTG